MSIFGKLFFTLIFSVLFIIFSYNVGHWSYLLIDYFFANPQSVFEFLFGSFLLVIIILLCLCILFSGMIGAFIRPFMDK